MLTEADIDISRSHHEGDNGEGFTRIKAALTVIGEVDVHLIPGAPTTPESLKSFDDELKRRILAYVYDGAPPIIL